MDNEIIGARIRELRKINGMSQADVAGKLYISNKVISSAEKGRTRPSLNTLIRIADLFSVSLDWLLGRTDQMELLP